MESIAAVDVRSVIGIVEAVNALDRVSNLEPSSESNDAGSSCSKLEADSTINASFT